MIRDACCRLARPLRAARWTGRLAAPGPEPRRPLREGCPSLASPCEFDYPFYAHLVACRRAPARR